MRDTVENDEDPRTWLSLEVTKGVEVGEGEVSVVRVRGTVRVNRTELGGLGGVEDLRSVRNVGGLKDPVGYDDRWYRWGGVRVLGGPKRTYNRRKRGTGVGCFT